MKIPFYKTSPAFMSILAITILAVAGCGGRGTGTGAAGGSAPPTIPGFDKYGSTTITAFTIFPDNGAVVGAINYGANLLNPNGDVDMFRFQASAGVTYVLQFQGFPAPSPDASDPDFINIEVLSNNGISELILSSLVPLPLETLDNGENRVTFIPQFTATHYIRITHARPLAGTGNYVFNLASSQLARGQSPIVTNTRPFSAVDAQGVVILPLTDVDGSLEIINFNPDTLELTVAFYSDGIFLVGSTEPETPEFHIHSGIPNNFDTGDINTTRGDDAHPSIQSFQGAPGGGLFTLAGIVTEDVFHLMIGHQWYLDVHFSGDLDNFPRPIVSSRANGTLNLFQSELEMSGANVVPPVNTINGLKLLYNSAFQTFMIDYEETVEASANAPFPDPSLVGGTMHVHSGGPGTNGQILIELGVLPPPLPINAYDPVPEFRNVIRVLRDAEVAKLRNAFYSGGFYVDIHTDTYDLDTPGELRAEGFLEIQTNPGGFAGGPN